MEALVHAGGRGTRMGRCGIEKPMQKVGDKHTVERVIEALRGSRNIEHIVVSVSDNTLETEKFLKDIGVDTIRTSGADFMGDLHQALEVMSSEYVLTCPSDLPLVTTNTIDNIIDYFVPGAMDSLLVVVDEDTVRGLGITPSYMREDGGNNWVLSGVSIINRQRTLAGEYLAETLYQTNWPELSINVNTPKELDLARSFFRE